MIIKNRIMSLLRNFFENNTQNAIHKWPHYFDIYENWFKKYQNKPVVILEIGVFQGGSLNMWRNYFGKKAKIYAIDINPECKQFELEGTEIFIGSQEDRKFLRDVKKRIPPIDILIDDGGHTMNQQIISFEELYGHIKKNGLYICEDLHTSYWKDYGGGYKGKKSFIEYSKNFIDSINAWHAKNNNLPITKFTETTFSLHYYPSMLVIEKRPMNSPISQQKGKIIIANNFPGPKAPNTITKKIRLLRKGIKEKLKKVFCKF